MIIILKIITTIVLGMIVLAFTRSYVMNIAMYWFLSGAKRIKTYLVFTGFYIASIAVPTALIIIMWV